jgi:hypothetical protein
MSPLIAVAYEPGHPGIPIHLDLTPQSPLSFPSAVFRGSERAGLRNSRLSSRFTIGSSLRTMGTSSLDSEMGHSVVSRDSMKDEITELPDIYKASAPASPRSTHPLQISTMDPSMSPGFVACRGCGKYHPHGFSHTKDERNSGSGAWWRTGSVRTKWRRRESQSTFFMEEDESSSEIGSSPMSP